MVSTDLAVREERPKQIVRLSTDQLQYIAHTEFVPKAMRGKLPQILACIAMGRELGLGDMVALNTIHVIDGRASLSAEAMVGLVRERGHSIQGNFSGDSCTVTGRRLDNGDEMTVTWTKEMAQDAGLLGKDNYKKYRPAMLWARAVSQLCRMLFADCFAGGTYTPDELEHDVPAEFEEIESSEPLAVSDAVGEPRTEIGEPDGTAVPAASADTDAQPSPTAPQLKKLNVLVGQLRDEANLITTPQLYLAVAREDYPWLADDAEPRWRDLRDALTKAEAHALIERLETFANEKGIGKAA